MNNNYIEYYVDKKGKLVKRKALNRVSIVFFAVIKFIFDRLLSIIGIIITLPIMIVIAILIKIDSKGPILFKQKRTGKNGKIFNMYKFRTMVASNNVYDFTKADEHTKIGKFLRKTSLDELPQLVTIAIGKMSFIGPRPWIPEYYENMNEIQRHRYDIRPGLTGLAQVNGRNNLTVLKKIDYDLQYIKNYSLLQDIKESLLIRIIL